MKFCIRRAKNQILGFFKMTYNGSSGQPPVVHSANLGRDGYFCNWSPFRAKGKILGNASGQPGHACQQAGLSPKNLKSPNFICIFPGFRTLKPKNRGMFSLSMKFCIGSHKTDFDIFPKCMLNPWVALIYILRVQCTWYSLSLAAACFKRVVSSVVSPGPSSYRPLLLFIFIKREIPSMICGTL